MPAPVEPTGGLPSVLTPPGAPQLVFELPASPDPLLPLLASFEPELPLLALPLPELLPPFDPLSLLVELLFPPLPLLLPPLPSLLLWAMADVARPIDSAVAARIFIMIVVSSPDPTKSEQGEVGNVPRHEAQFGLRQTV